ncbi:cytochrome c-type biogenesis protein [Usitatibacter palustris]|uniref:Cytochrome c-type biogenesis protein n=1 Tax=Usitatibacter palustris TaxID=2732487 RepID=A0A6M4HAD5_9PROT|nr:cytochrome c-type biogenesis protein [Usitatibacter palustris]QJR15007.1 hypothetical protein DSM104440_01823 [Usitatibacter palustris]
MTRALLLVLGLAVVGGALGQANEVAKPDPVVEQRLRGLAEELRCLVCQNQTIADSNAPLALDLRNQIRDQIGKGATDAQIRDYMVQRYGDFVLYRPPFKATTLVLWLLPAFALFAGAFLVWRIVRPRAKAATAAPVEGTARRKEIEKLLSGDDSNRA